jgi:hypothetical protein
MAKQNLIYQFGGTFPPGGGTGTRSFSIFGTGNVVLDVTPLMGSPSGASYSFDIEWNGMSVTSSPQAYFDGLAPFSMDFFKSGTLPSDVYITLISDATEFSIDATLTYPDDIPIGLESGYRVSPYNAGIIYEFEPIFNLNTGDLSTTATGYAVHRGKDVSFVFDVTDRQLNVLNSTYALTENPFVQSLNIDILDIYGNTVSGGYVTGSFSNLFTLTEQENINIFGQYAKDFGVGVSAVGSNAYIHSSKYYVCASYLEIENISVTDAVGSWLNFTPLQNQSGYSDFPYRVMESKSNFQYVTNNALYFKDYSLVVSGYSGYVSGTIPVAISGSEYLKIDWGDNQIDNISYSSVYPTDTGIGELELSGMISPTGINGQTYSFVAGHSYPTGTTGIQILKFYYSGIDSTGNELIKTDEYRIPDELYPQGNPRIGDLLTGLIRFDINFINNPLYTTSDKLSIYSSTDSGVALDTGNLIAVIPILTNLKNYSFTLNDSLVKPNIPQWFKIVPSSEIGDGYAWEIGPYSLYKAPILKTNIISESFSLLNGDSTADIDFLTGLVETNSVRTIDTLLKGSKYSYEYFTQFKDQSGCYCSSKILIVDNTSGADLSRTGLSFHEYGRSANSFVNYSISGDAQNIYLNAQLNTPTGIYKLYKTSI